MKTILYINHSGRVSGSEASLLRIVAALDRNRYRPIVACPAESDLWHKIGAETERAALPTFDLSYKGGLRNVTELLRAMRGLWRLYRRYKPQIIHANTSRAALVCCILRLLMPFFTPKLVTHVRDDVGRGRANRVIRLILGLCSTRIIGVSTYATAQAHVSIFDHKYRTVFDGVDPAEFDPSRVANDGRGLRTEVGLPQDAYPVVGVVGQLTPWKGQTEAIAAMREVVKEYPHAVMLIIGESKFRGTKTQFDTQAYEHDLKTYVTAHDLDKHVIFCGELTDMPRVMRALDVMCLVSWSEPFGLVYIEAMAMARPVIATTIGGPADIVVEAETGLCVLPHDPHAIAAAICRLAAAPQEAEKMGQRGRARILAHFTNAHQARALEAIYAQL